MQELLLETRFGNIFVLALPVLALPISIIHQELKVDLNWQLELDDETVNEIFSPLNSILLSFVLKHLEFFAGAASRSKRLDLKFVFRSHM